LTIYIDVIFIENVIMNLSIVLSESIILNLKTGFLRKLIASIIGTLFYLLQLFFSVRYLQIIISLLVIWIAFKPNKIKIFLKELLVFYFISFLFGGISFALMNLKNDGIFKIVGGVLVGNFSLIFVFSSAFIGFAILYFILKERNKKVFKEIIIGIDNLEFKVNVFLDTGNLLKEPYTDRPVIIVEKEALNELICEKCGENFEMIIRGEAEIPLGMFLIPYRSLGNSSGFLLGIKPSYVQDVETKKLYNDLVIGICSENISDNNNYSGIFGLETLDERVCSL